MRRYGLVAAVSLLLAACLDDGISPPSGAGIRLPDNPRLSAGDSIQLGVLAGGRPVTYLSSDPRVFTVDSKGTLRALAPGEGVVTAYVAGRPGERTSTRVVVQTAQLKIIVQNQLLYPVSIVANGSVVGKAAANQTTEFAILRPDTLQLSWELDRPLLGNGKPVGPPLRGRYATETISSDQTTFVIDNVVGTTTLFAPLITNEGDTPLLVGVNMGLPGEFRCECIAPPGAERVLVGYYRLEAGSNVRGYTGTSYGGSHVEWKDFANQIVGGSGALLLQVGPGTDPGPGGQGPGGGRSLTVTPSVIVLGVGQGIQLSATLDGLATSQVGWSTTAPGVASLSPAGGLTATRRGQATVVARSGNALTTANVRVLDRQPALVRGSLAVARTGNPSVPTVAFGADGSRSALLTSRSGAVEGAMLIAPDGKALVTYFNAQGLPQRMVIDETVVLFDNYRADKVDVAFLPPVGEPVILRDQKLNPDVSREAQRFVGASLPAPGPGAVSLSLQGEASGWQGELKRGMLAFSTTACIMGAGPAALAAMPTMGASVIVWTAGCTFTALKVAAFLTDTENTELVKSAEQFSTVTDLVGCGAGLGCAEAVVSTVDELAKTFDAVYERMEPKAKQVGEQLKKRPSTCVGSDPCAGGAYTQQPTSMHEYLNALELYRAQAARYRSLPEILR